MPCVPNPHRPQHAPVRRLAARRRNLHLASRCHWVDYPVQRDRPIAAARTPTLAGKTRHPLRRVDQPAPPGFRQCRSQDRKFAVVARPRRPRIFAPATTRCVVAPGTTNDAAQCSRVRRRGRRPCLTIVSGRFATRRVGQWRSARSCYVCWLRTANRTVAAKSPIERDQIIRGHQKIERFQSRAAHVLPLI